MTMLGVVYFIMLFVSCANFLPFVFLMLLFCVLEVRPVFSR